MERDNWMRMAGRESTRAFTWTESRHATEDHSCKCTERTSSGGTYAGAAWTRSIGEGPKMEAVDPKCQSVQ
jgi:hypothetical protein